MCWSFEVSVATLVVGTVLNGLGVWGNRRHGLRYAGLAASWQYVLLMQLSEAIIWSDPAGGTRNVVGTASALFFNMTQPTAALVGLGGPAWKAGGFAEAWRLPAAAVLGGAYVVWLVVVAIGGAFTPILPSKTRTPSCGSLTQYFDTAKTAACHIKYPWWDNLPLGGGAPYMVSMFGSVLLLSPLRFGIFTFVFVAASLAFSARFFHTAVGSMWCFHVLAIIMLNPFMWRLLVPEEEAQA
jgi:hypothetical protein